MLKESKSKKFKILIKVTAFAVIVGLLNVGMVLSADAATKKRPADEFVEYVKMVYEQEWKYVWGGETAGTVDCSGMIYLFAGGPRTSWNMIESDAEKGDISTMPDIPGIILWRPGHVGVYIGGGMEIDARNSTYNVVMDYVYKNGKTSWTKWIKHPNIDYSVYTDTSKPTSSAPAPATSKEELPAESAATSSSAPVNSKSESIQSPVSSEAESSRSPESSRLPESSSDEAIMEINPKSKPPQPESRAPLPESSAPAKPEESEELIEPIPNPGFMDIGIPDTVYLFKTFEEYFRMYDTSRKLKELPVDEWAMDIGEKEYYTQKPYDKGNVQTYNNGAHRPGIFIV